MNTNSSDCTQYGSFITSDEVRLEKAKKEYEKEYEKAEKELKFLTDQGYIGYIQLETDTDGKTHPKIRSFLPARKCFTEESIVGGCVIAISIVMCILIAFL